MEIAFYSVALIVLFLGYRLFLIERRFFLLYKGLREKNVEALLWKHSDALDGLQKESIALRQAVEGLEKNFLRSVQKVGIVRFNPFSDSGGDQSFSIVLLDGEDNGIAISGLYSQGRPLVYAKPIKRGQSRYKLSEEEREAYTQAVKVA
jgi:hypothetical protein